MFFHFESYEDIRLCIKKSWDNTAYLSHRYFVNILLMHLFIGAAKLFTGAHRPHFFETCLPDRMLNCTLGTFVNSYECTNKSESMVNILDASMSFFSGHAASCVFSCLFICWYLQLRSKSTSLFLVPFVQTSLLCLAYFGSISRVFDHRHHWWDVLTGAFLGVVTTFHTVSYRNVIRLELKLNQSFQCYVLCQNRYAKPESKQKLPTDISNTFLETCGRTTGSE